LKRVKILIGTAIGTHNTKPIMGSIVLTQKGSTHHIPIIKYPMYTNIITIPSYDGLCVIGKSEGDGHRSSEWLNDGKFRVTIAFDIIPVESFKVR
jgi:hypothetical protein